jgi:hypothetical protein
VAWRGDYQQLVLVEDLGLKIFLLDEAFGQPNVQVVPRQPAVDLLGVLDLDQKLDPRAPAWATAWKTARWFRFMLITFCYRFCEKDVLDLSTPLTV